MKLKVFIHAQYNEYDHTFSYSAHYCNMQEYGYTLIETREIDFDQPNHERLVNQTIQVLREKQKKIRAEAEKSYAKVYIGDSVYAQVGSYAGEIILTTENGLPNDPSNTIVLGPNEMRALIAFSEAKL